MNTADGNYSDLDSSVSFEMRVIGIWRTVHASIFLDAAVKIMTLAFS